MPTTPEVGKKGTQTNTVYVGEDFCAFRRMNHTEQSIRIRRGSGGDYCPICRKPVDKPGSVYIIINNGRLFPNCWAHGDCVDELGLQAAAEAITYDYADYKLARDRFAAWVQDRALEAEIHWHQNKGL